MLRSRKAGVQALHSSGLVKMGDRTSGSTLSQSAIKEMDEEDSAFWRVNNLIGQMYFKASLSRHSGPLVQLFNFQPSNCKYLL